MLAGIGRATALALAQCGAEVVAVTRTKADLDSLVEEVTALCSCGYGTLVRYLQPNPIGLMSDDIFRPYSGVLQYFMCQALLATTIPRMHLI